MKEAAMARPKKSAVTNKITVKAIDADAPPCRFPNVVNQVGASPPQYLDFDDEEGDSSEEEE
jgi:hypothetical protein